MIEQLPPQLRDEITNLVPRILDGGLNLLSAILILLFGIWLAGWLRVWTIRALGRFPHMDAMLQNFFGTVVRYLVLTFTIVAVLAKFGVETTSLIAVLGAAGLAVGLALQGTLSNVAAGVMLLIIRPFRAGHSVEIGGMTGTVRTLSLFTTELTTYDNIQIIIPNSDIWGQPIKNFSFHPTRMLETVFTVSYENDLNRVMEVIREEVANENRCLTQPAPFTGILKLGEGTADIVMRAWVATSDLWSTRLELNRKIKERFAADGIIMPSPNTLFTVSNLDAARPDTTSPDKS